MNFKDAYKAANNEIHGDKSILAGITTSKPKKVIYFKPAMGVAVAAAVCLVTVIVYPYIMPSPEQTSHDHTGYFEDIGLNSNQPVGMSTEDDSVADLKQEGLSQNEKQPHTVKSTAAETTETYTFSTKNFNGSADMSAAQYTQEEAIARMPATAEAFTPEGEGKEEMVSDIEASQGEEKDEPLLDSASTEAVADSAAGEEKFVTPSDASAGGGGASASRYSTCLKVSEDLSHITVNLRGVHELTLAISESTVVESPEGEKLSISRLKSGVLCEVFYDEKTLTATRIIII